MKVRECCIFLKFISHKETLLIISEEKNGINSLDLASVLHKLCGKEAGSSAFFCFVKETR